MKQPIPAPNEWQEENTRHTKSILFLNHSTTTRSLSLFFDFSHEKLHHTYFNQPPNQEHK